MRLRRKHERVAAQVSAKPTVWWTTSVEAADAPPVIRAERAAEAVAAKSAA